MHTRAEPITASSIFYQHRSTLLAINVIIYCPKKAEASFCGARTALIHWPTHETRREAAGKVQCCTFHKKSFYGVIHYGMINHWLADGSCKYRKAH